MFQKTVLRDRGVHDALKALMNAVCPVKGIVGKRFETRVSRIETRVSNCFESFEWSPGDFWGGLLYLCKCMLKTQRDLKDPNAAVQIPKSVIGDGKWADGEGIRTGIVCVSGFLS